MSSDNNENNDTTDSIAEAMSNATIDHDETNRSADCVHECKICNQQYKNYSIVPKQTDGSKPRVVYFCNLCGRHFPNRSSMINHLATEKPCFEIRDINYFKNIITWGDINRLEDQFIANEEEFDTVCRSVQSVEDIIAAKALLKKIQAIFSKLLAYTRIQVELNRLNPDRVNKLEDLLSKYKERLAEIRQRYIILLF
jgi:hypothetical protein